MSPQISIPSGNEERLPPPSDFEQKGKSSAGPVIGIIIIIVLLIVGALYFWGAHLNNSSRQNQIPYIPGDPSTTSVQ